MAVDRSDLVFCVAYLTQHGKRLCWVGLWLFSFSAGGAASQNVPLAELTNLNGIAIERGDAIHRLTADPQGGLWLTYRAAQPAKLWYFDSLENQYVQSLEDMTIETILVLDHHIVVGTQRKGMWVLDLDAQRWSPLNDDTFLVSNPTESFVWLNHLGLGWYACLLGLGFYWFKHKRNRSAEPMDLAVMTNGIIPPTTFLPSAPERAVQPKATTIHYTQQAFIEKINRVLAKNYSHNDFNVSKFANEMASSRRQLSRKMKMIMGESPAESIRNYRLIKAEQKLAKNESPSGVAYDVGFSSHAYFSRCFKAKYHCLPCNYLSHKNNMDRGK